MRNEIVVQKMAGYVRKVLDYCRGYDYAAFSADSKLVEACVFNLSQLAFPARNRGSGRPLPPFRNRIKLKKDDTSFLLTPNGVFFLALSHSIRHNLFPGHSLSTGRIFEVAPPLFPGKQKAGIPPGLQPVEKVQRKLGFFLCMSYN